MLLLAQQVRRGLHRHLRQQEQGPCLQDPGPVRGAQDLAEAQPLQLSRQQPLRRRLLPLQHQGHLLRAICQAVWKAKDNFG